MQPDGISWDSRVHLVLVAKNQYTEGTRWTFEMTLDTNGIFVRTIKPDGSVDNLGPYSMYGRYPPSGNPGVCYTQSGGVGAWKEGTIESIEYAPLSASAPRIKSEGDSRHIRRVIYQRLPPVAAAFVGRSIGTATCRAQQHLCASHWHVLFFLLLGLVGWGGALGWGFVAPLCGFFVVGWVHCDLEFGALSLSYFLDV